MNMKPQVIMVLPTLKGSSVYLDVFGTIIGGEQYSVGTCNPMLSPSLDLTNDPKDDSTLPANYDIMLATSHTIFGVLGNFQHFMQQVKANCDKALQQLQQQQESGLVIAGGSLPPIQPPNGLRPG
jgi:hypothetical protein